jgi:hypothetical protein
MKRVFFVIFVILTAFLGTRNARAATTTAETAGSLYAANDIACGVTEGDLTAIEVIQNNASLNYYDELQQELAARRNLLSKTIQCAEDSARQAQTDLKKTVVDQNLESIKNQWIDRLSSAILYYDLQLQKINEVGISGTKSIAKEVLAWRENNYAPLADNVLSFIMWSNNQALFRAAESRLSQINNLASSPLFSESLDVQNDYEEAAVSLKTAEDQNASAKNAFSQSLSPDQSFLFIKESLDSLSSTYQRFFDISNLIQSLLPH